MKKFGVFKLLLLCAIVAVVSAVPTLAVAKNKRAGLEDSLKEKESEFQGVLTVWNVDTFESGIQSKTSYIEQVGVEFSDLNKGLYVLVKNLTVEEMTANFLNNTYPDVISFGYGIGQIVKPLLLDLGEEKFKEVRREIKDSGKCDNEQLAIGYLMGGYILASTEEKLINAGKSSTDSLINLIDIAGFNTETKIGVKHTSSLVCGENKYINPVNFVSNALSRELTDVHLSVNGYEAYSDFVGYNKGTILLGTQRDLFKLSGRVAVGKISGVKTEFISGATNLVQYLGVIKNNSEEKLQLAKKFVEYLVCEPAQKHTKEIGMVNTIGKSFYDEGVFKNLEENLNGEIRVPSLF